MSEMRRRMEVPTYEKAVAFWQRNVDRSRVISEQLIESPVLGMITPVQLSRGVKTLILIANDKNRKTRQH